MFGAPLNISGTYFTVWTYDDVNPADLQLGPVIVIGVVLGTSIEIDVDGVSIQGATANLLPGQGQVLVAWPSSVGNPSSGNLLFSATQSFMNGAVTFSGTYFLADQSAPSGSNLNGFNTQPAEDLATWNDTYFTYMLVNGENVPQPNVVISSPSVTFGGKTIINPIYTGVTSQVGNGVDVNELAWYTSDGNDHNVAISIFDSSPPGFLLFHGCIWDAGANRLVGAVGSPSAADNFFGTTQAPPAANNQNQQVNEQVDNEAEAGHQAIVGGVVATVGLLAVAAGAAAGVGIGANKIAQEAGQAQELQAQQAQRQAVPNNADEDLEDDEAIGDIEGAANIGGASAAHRVSKRPTGLSAKQLLKLKNKP